MTCTCKSYNQPKGYQVTPSRVVPVPEWASNKIPTICLDECIADAILKLWENKIWTKGSCCGHNEGKPSIVLADPSDAQRAHIILTECDGREWDVYGWVLTKL